MPTAGQLILLLVACLLMAGAFGVSLARLRKDRPGQRLLAKVLVYLGLVAALLVVIWHAAARRDWIPLGDNFETMIWLGIMLGAFMLYVQRTKPLGGLDWFLLPVVTLLLGTAGLFGSATHRSYEQKPWDLAHLTTSYGGAVAFAVAFAAGLMYLHVNRRLRAKQALPGANLGSLERLEHLTQTSVRVGFALLTVGLLTGFVKIAHEHGNTALGRHWFGSPKVILSAAVWLVYGVVLHSPINPSFRGRKAAMLSIVGFVLMVGTIVAVQFMPETRP